MKITRYFIQHVGEETGLDGWLPLWIPKSAGFDPFASPVGLVHDMLEHRLCDSGLFHEELMAMGRLIALRSVPGVDQGRSIYSYEESLGIEVSGAWAQGDGDREEATIVEPPPTAELDSHVEGRLHDLIDSCLKTLPGDLEDHCAWRGDVALDYEQFGASMLGWLRIGYRDALRRYGQQDHGCWDNGHAAFRWARSNEKRMDRELEECCPGSVLRLCWDTVQLQMDDRVLEPNDKYGTHPQWLRHRIWSWRNR